MKPSNPTLWNEMKSKARKSSVGSPAGRWSSRKAALARHGYEKRGGKWIKTTVPKLSKTSKG